MFSEDPDRQSRRDRGAHPRTCREMGIPAVVAFSEPDRESMAVRQSDEAICIGPAEARRSYLNQPALISAALITGCDAIHPGYGFLSEDASFAEACAVHELDVHRASGTGPRAVRVQVRGPPDAGGQWPAHRPRQHGDRGRPGGCAGPGRGGGLPGPPQAISRWRGPRHAPRPLPARDGDASCRSPVPRRGRRSGTTRCTSSAGSRTTATSKSRSSSIARPRDPPRRAGLLGPAAAPEDHRGGPRRPWTSQRASGSGPRHSVGGRGGVRERGNARVPPRPGGQLLLHRDQLPDPGRAPGDRDAHRVDLVAEQIRIAAGEPLAMTQEQVVLRGHAIEFRITAEDPHDGFAPQTGVVTDVQLPGRRRACGWTPISTPATRSRRTTTRSSPSSSSGARTGRGAGPGARALAECQIDGVKTNLAFHRAIVDNAAFVDAEVSTNLLDRVSAPPPSSASQPERRTDDDRPRPACAGPQPAAAPLGGGRHHGPSSRIGIRSSSSTGWSRSTPASGWSPSAT